MEPSRTYDSSEDAALEADGGAADAALDARSPYDGADGEAGAPGDSGCAVGTAGEALHLACAGLYSDWPTKTVAPDFRPFVPGLTLWSDGADKTRWVHLPPGQRIDTSNMDAWTFPVGTKLFKEFRLPVAGSPGRRRIETRMLWKQAEGSWFRTTYR